MSKNNSPRERDCDLPVDIDCEVTSTPGFKDKKEFIKRAIGKFRIHQNLTVTEPKKDSEDRLTFQFYGTVGSPTIAARIKRHMSRKGTIQSWAC